MGLKEFRRMTPIQFESLRERYLEVRKEKESLLELLLAQQAWLTFNTRMTYAKQPAKITDFMPSKWTKKVELPEKSRKRRGKSGLPLVCEGFATIMKMLGAKGKS